ncbi:MAG: hypothetical protein A2Z71_06160 [Chloroflexi bacterium RBG_13_50_21]|nr:MAG: hypothetical protein A2Z71_06160 [Chloroflexi bacterium RBG_13_50_21]
MLGTRSNAQAGNPAALSPLEQLGKALFFDEDLSFNGNQSCATCHGPAVGFTGPDAQVNASSVVYPGSYPDRFGNRKPPAAAYAGDSPLLQQDASGSWFGGMFWDGRATGAILGDPLAEQAQGPFLNPLEQAIPDAQTLCNKVAGPAYVNLYVAAWGSAPDCVSNVNGVYENIGRSVAAYERSREVNPFSSKFDKFWDRAKAKGKDVTKIKCGTGGRRGSGGDMGCSGSGTDPNRWSMFRNLGLTDNELIGLAVFNTQAGCSSCHSLTPATAGSHPLFTDFGYANLGVPKNPDNPFYSMDPQWNPDGENWVDLGLGGYLQSIGDPAYETELGKQKVPTLRNVDLRPDNNFVKAYMHNGYFKSLEDIVTFYHWRAMMSGGCGGMGGGGMGGGGMGGGCGGMEGMFPPPEVDLNLATLNMFPMMQVSNIVTFLKTLSDGYQP